MDKLIFPVARDPRVKRCSQPVRVSAYAYNVIEEISAKTGLSNSYIASQMILYARQHTKLTFDDDTQE